MPIVKIVSGGQTGADRAALDVAIGHGLEVGGWVPKSRRAEDGRIPEHYSGLVETDSTDPAVRTAWNVRDSDATLIVSHGRLSGGSGLTLEEATGLGRPVLHLDLHELGAASATTRLRAWLADVSPRVLNVAGPRASGDPTIYAAVTTLLRSALVNSDGTHTDV